MNMSANGIDGTSNGTSKHPAEQPQNAPIEPIELADFTATRRMVFLAMIRDRARDRRDLRRVCAAPADRAVYHLFFFQRFAFTPASPASHTLGVASIVVPVAGALIIGLMARYGSERNRGHGIPEALEAILTRGSRVEPRVALLKPVSSAISIGSGGPFGAEGPIIMTGGAVGSLVAQLTHETLRSAVARMAERGVTRLLAVKPGERKARGRQDRPPRPAQGRARHLEDEHRRERILPFEYLLPAWLRPQRPVVRDQT